MVLFNSETIYCGIIIFVGDQCSWLSWVTLTNEYTSPRTYICFVFIYKINFATDEITSHEPGKFWPPTNIDSHE